MKKQAPVIDIEKLTQRSQKINSLVNIRVEKDTWNSFQKLCEKEIKLSASEVLRRFMHEMCIQEGYLKK